MYLNKTFVLLLFFFECMGYGGNALITQDINYINASISTFTVIQCDTTGTSLNKDLDPNLYWGLNKSNEIVVYSMSSGKLMTFGTNGKLLLSRDVNLLGDNFYVFGENAYIYDFQTLYTIGLIDGKIDSVTFISPDTTSIKYILPIFYHNKLFFTNSYANNSIECYDLESKMVCQNITEAKVDIPITNCLSCPCCEVYKNIKKNSRVDGQSERYLLFTKLYLKNDKYFTNYFVYDKIKCQINIIKDLKHNLFSCQNEMGTVRFLNDSTAIFPVRYEENNRNTDSLVFYKAILKP